jgi:hypothetical protein
VSILYGREGGGGRRGGGSVAPQGRRRVRPKTGVEQVLQRQAERDARARARARARAGVLPGGTACHPPARWRHARRGRGDGLSARALPSPRPGPPAAATPPAACA